MCTIRFMHADAPVLERLMVEVLVIVLAAGRAHTIASKLQFTS